MHLATIDLIVLAAYAVFIFVLAQVVSRRGKTGEARDATDYFLASRSLPWWAIGASLIAANISAEQIVGMSGSGYAIGLAIASYEWMAAATLIVVGVLFLPIFLRNKIYTMPQFLEQRFGGGIRTVMAVFWLALYVLVNLTSILWLGSIAVNTVTGMPQMQAFIALGAFAYVYSVAGGLKAVAMTDIVQVTLLVIGGFIITGLTLNQIGGGDIVRGFHTLVERTPDHFHMILKEGDPHYKELPGLAVILGGMWIANISYWGFNQYIIQRALAAKSLREAQTGVVFAAFLKLLMPVIIVLPGIAAVVLAPMLGRPDQAYPTMMQLLPPGLLGLVFAALCAAIVASTASKINSIATIFTLDLYDKRGTAGGRGQHHLVTVGRITGAVAVVIATIVAKPLIGSFDQGFQFIQEFTGFVTPGIVVIFLIGLFWKRGNEAGAIAAAMASVAGSLAFWKFVPDLPFLHRMGWVFLASLALAVAVSLATPARADVDRIETRDVDYSTSGGFKLGALAVLLILIALYATWW
jgi:SSS family solute:Na+ symporter